MALTPKQERFCEEYLIDLNATAAYKRAGYTANGHSAESAAERLLRNVEVQARVTQLQAARSERTQITADRVLKEIAAVAFSDIGDVLDFSGTEPHLRPVNEIPQHARRAISSVKVRRYWEGHGDSAREVEVTEFKLWPKVEAARDLGRHLKLFTDNVNLSNIDDAIRAELARLAGRRQVGDAGTTPANGGPADDAG